MLEQALAAATLGRRLLGFWGPMGNADALFGPLAAISSVLLLAMLTGVAVGSLSTLILSAAVLYYVLTEVFGVSFEFNF